VLDTGRVGRCRSWLSGCRPIRLSAKGLLLWATGIGIDGIILASAIFTGTAFIFAPDLADGIGFAGLVLTRATLLLALVAAAVAVLAHAVITGDPELAISARFLFSEAKAHAWLPLKIVASRCSSRPP